MPFWLKLIFSFGYLQLNSAIKMRLRPNILNFKTLFFNVWAMVESKLVKDNQLFDESIIWVKPKEKWSNHQIYRWKTHCNLKKENCWKTSYHAWNITRKKTFKRHLMCVHSAHWTRSARVNCVPSVRNYASEVNYIKFITSIIYWKLSDIHFLFRVTFYRKEIHSIFKTVLRAITIQMPTQNDGSLFFLSLEICNPYFAWHKIVMQLFARHKCYRLNYRRPITHYGIV